LTFAHLLVEEGIWEKEGRRARAQKDEGLTLKDLHTHAINEF